MSRQFRSDDTSQWLYGFGDGSDGALTVSTSRTESDSNYAGCSGTSGSSTLSIDAAGNFSNFDLVLIHQSRGTGVGNWELNRISSGGGGTTLTLTHPLQNTYSNSGASQAQVVRMLQYSSVTINSGISWYPYAWDGNKGGILAFFCASTTTITGSLNNDGRGYLGPSSWGWTGGDGWSYAGEGTSGATVLQGTANGSGGGGGWRDSGSSDGGAGGGHAATGSAGLTDGHLNNGGTTSGNAALTSMTFGGAGGSGGTSDDGSVGGKGGNGGGIVFIVTQNISITGNITCDGDTGGTPSPGGVNDSGAGGGGAGGSILIKAQTATLGTNKVTAAGGAGGVESIGPGYNGGAGSVGRVHLDYRDSYTGTTSPTLNVTQDATLDWIPTEEESYSIML